MIFGHSDHAAALLKYRAEIVAGDQSWRKTIAARWGEFLDAEIQRRRLKWQRMVDNCTSYPDADRVRDFAMNKLAEVAGLVRTAEDVKSGRAPLSDPIGAEAVLRALPPGHPLRQQKEEDNGSRRDVA